MPQAKPEAAAHGAKLFDIIGGPGYPAPLQERRAAIARQRAAIVASPPRNDLMTSVTAPTLVPHGADDPLIPVEAAHDTARKIRNAKHRIAPGMGRDFTDAPAPAMARDIAGFCRGVEAQRQAEE